MSDELKKCPWCRKLPIRNDANLNMVKCIDNSCPGSVAWMFESYWQSRPLENALIAERDALKVKLEIAKDGVIKAIRGHREDIYKTLNELLHELEEKS